ncbi:MAG: ATP-dependent nuclease [Oceanicaulis sp.]
MLKPTATIESLTFSSGERIEIGPSEKIIVVGPNNSGKSQLLRDIRAACECPDRTRLKGIVLKDIKLAKSGSAEDLKAFLDKEAALYDNTYRYKNWRMHIGSYQQYKEEFLHTISDAFIKNISANERLSICNPQNSISPDQQKTAPQHVLYDDEKLMLKISNLFESAFNNELMFDFRGGSTLPIHVGKRPVGPDMIDRVGDAYVDAVRSNPLLHKQGDGMKSYAGLLFDAVVLDLDMTLIDEPEAFLHPPQMRKLGQTLASEVKGQLFIATHSSDILRGFLEGTKGDVRIIRIERRGNTNHIHEASPVTIKTLWEKPELRYSNALESIFHEQAIICEDDSDCRLFNSVGDHVAGAHPEAWGDTAYIPTGGKHAVPSIASALRDIGVPLKAVLDIDFLADKDLGRRTVEAFGGDWTEIELHWDRLDAAVRAGIKPKSAKDIKEEIRAIIDKAATDELPKSDIQKALRGGSEWAYVKRFGQSAIPKGDAQRHFQETVTALQQIGIYVICEGEVESFCPEIGSHGPKYVTSLLSSIPLNDPRLTALRTFTEKLHSGRSSRGDLA